MTLCWQLLALPSRALSEFRIAGVADNISFLQNILRHRDFVASKVHTRWVDAELVTLAAPTKEVSMRFVAIKGNIEGQAEQTETEPQSGFAGAKVDSNDPLALFTHDAKVKAEQAAMVEVESPMSEITGPNGSVGMRSPIQGTIVSIDVSVGDEVRANQGVAVVEAMKMEHVITTDCDGIVREITMAAGDVVQEAVARRYARGYRMPRQNIAELMDAGSFKEY